MPSEEALKLAKLLLRIGDPTGHVLADLVLKLGDLPQDLNTILGYEGATSLHNKLTAARAAFLDAAISSRLAAAAYVTERGTDSAALASVCTEARLAELGAANLPAGVDGIKAQTDKLAGASLQGTASAGTSVATDIFLMAITAKRKIHAVWIDLVNLTANATITLFYKIGGTTYREFESLAWTTADADGVYFNKALVMEHDFRVMIVGGEPVAVNIPYEVHYENM